MSTRNTVKGAFAALTAAVLAAGLTGCLQLGPEAPQRGPDGQVTEPMTISVFDLQVGDCIDDEGTGELGDIRIVPCSMPHQDEVYHEFRLADGDFPGDEVLEEAFLDECVSAFERFIGSSVQDTELRAYPMTPTAQSWAERDDRVMQCVVYDPEGPTTGSLQNSKR